MQAVLLATSETNKLWPLTDAVPSPLMPIANRPIMELAVELLARHGVKNIVVCLYRFPGSIESYFGNGRRWGVNIQYVLLKEAWGNAGALHWAKTLISESFIVMPADAIVDLDVCAALDEHSTNQNIATSVIKDAVADDNLEFQMDNVNHYLRNYPQVNSDKLLCETGVYLFEPQALDFIQARKKMDISTHLFPAITAAGLPVGTLETTGYWNRLESFHDIQRAQKKYLHSALDSGTETLSNSPRFSYPFISGQQYAPGIWVGKNNTIHPSVNLAPPVLLGDNIRIGRGAIIGPEVIIGANVIVDDEATIHNSTIFAHTYIGQLVHIQDRLVDKNLIVDTNSSDYLRIVDRFLLRKTPHSLEHSIFVRVLDTMIASMLLLLTAPLTLFIGLALFILTGKIIQTVPRINNKPTGQEFEDASACPVMHLYRFRTRDLEGDYTVFGKFLENLDWHRIPELINVILGDLRLVGVKPLSLDEVEQLCEEWQQKHDDYYPGFTGLWFIQSGQDGELNEILIADVYYVVTRSWKEDLRILWRTPRAWFGRTGKSGASFIELRQETEVRDPELER